MSSIIERNLYDDPILFIKEREVVTAYTKNYTASGLPYYVPPEGKNRNDLYQLFEIIFLPVSKEDFKTIKDHYFFGFRILINLTNEKIINLINPETGQIGVFITIQIRFEVTRIRYYPSGEQSIVINRSYDSLFPTQLVNVQAPSDDVPGVIDKGISNIIDKYTSYYVDKKI